MTVLRAVFIDVGDPLVDFDRAALAALAALAATLGRDVDHELEGEHPHHRRFECGELDFQVMQELRMANFLAVVGRKGDVQSAPDLEVRRFVGLSHHYALYDDLLRCLEMLRARGFLLGLIPDSVASDQRHKIAAVGLAELFAAVVISGELGVVKPDPAVFEHVCAALGVDAHEAMHVGDNLVIDACGARDAGRLGVWLDLRGTHGGAHRDPELGVTVVSGLAQLADLVA